MNAHDTREAIIVVEETPNGEEGSSLPGIWLCIAPLLVPMWGLYKPEGLMLKFICRDTLVLAGPICPCPCPWPCPPGEKLLEPGPLNPSRAPMVVPPPLILLRRAMAYREDAPLVILRIRHHEGYALIGEKGRARVVMLPSAAAVG